MSFSQMFGSVASSASAFISSATESIASVIEQVVDEKDSTNIASPQRTPQNPQYQMYEIDDCVIEFVNALSEDSDHDSTFIHFPLNKKNKYNINNNNNNNNNRDHVDNSHNDSNNNKNDNDDNNNISNNNPSDSFEMTPHEEAHARKILSLSESFARQRYRLCPKHINDQHFWRVYFILLKNFHRHRLSLTPHNKNSSQNNNDNDNNINSSGLEGKDNNKVNMNNMNNNNMELGLSESFLSRLKENGEIDDFDYEPLPFDKEHQLHYDQHHQKDNNQIDYGDDSYNAGKHEELINQSLHGILGNELDMDPELRDCLTQPHESLESPNKDPLHPDFLHLPEDEFDPNLNTLPSTQSLANNKCDEEVDGLP